MKTPAKLAVISAFLVLGAMIFASTGIGSAASRFNAMSMSIRSATPTPTPTPVPKATATPAAAASDKTIPKSFVLGKDSLSEYGEVPFDHDTHAFAKYSPDGKSVVGCVECHHTDQPKSAMSPPYVTSERDVVLTFDNWKTSTQKVSECRACHFQEGSVPDDKTMPSLEYTVGSRKVTRDLNNELAYHINCNTCHDEAAKLRPEVKRKAGFATSKDCMICHKPN